MSLHRAISDVKSNMLLSMDFDILCSTKRIFPSTTQKLNPIDDKC